MEAPWWLSWVCFGTTCCSIYFDGNRKLTGPLFGILGFAPWTATAYLTEQWGIVATSFVVLYLQSRKMYLWKKDGLTWN